MARYPPIIVTAKLLSLSGSPSMMGTKRFKVKVYNKDCSNLVFDNQTQAHAEYIVCHIICKSVSYKTPDTRTLYQSDGYNQYTHKLWVSKIS